MESRISAGYARGVKIAISIPDRLFRDERLARTMRQSRSQLYSHAITEYLILHAPDAVTDAMNKVCDEVGSACDAVATAVSCRMLRKETW